MSSSTWLGLCSLGERTGENRFMPSACLAGLTPGGKRLLLVLARSEGPEGLRFDCFPVAVVGSTARVAWSSSG